MAGRGGYFCFVFGAASGGADDMHDARLRGVAGELDTCGRRGEIEHAVGLGKGRQRVVGDFHAERADACELAGVLTNLRRAFSLDRCGDRCAGNGVDRADERLAHSASGSNDDETHIARLFGHVLFLQFRQRRPAVSTPNVWGARA